MTSLPNKSPAAAGLRLSVAVHGAIALGLLALLLWPIENYLENFINIFDPFPEPFRQAVTVYRITREHPLCLLAAVLTFLWLDLKFLRFIQRRIGARIAAWWSASVLAALGAFGLWLLYALASVNDW